MNAFIVLSLACGSGPHDYYVQAIMLDRACTGDKAAREQGIRHAVAKNVPNCPSGKSPKVVPATVARASHGSRECAR
jgi:hypothetical protein